MTLVECDHGEVFGPGFACPACQPQSLRQLATDLDLHRKRCAVWSCDAYAVTIELWRAHGRLIGVDLCEQHARRGGA